jgi:uncharacterized membrane protein
MEVIFLTVLLVYVLYANSKFNALEKKIAMLKSLLEKTSSTTIQTTVVTDQHQVMPARQANQSVPQVTEMFSPRTVQATRMYDDTSVLTQPVTTDAFSAWVKQDFLVKLGGLLLLIALGWFVSYAFANNWIGEVGRITLGILFGVLLMIVGVLRISKYPSQGAIFTVLGSTTVLLTIFAARGLYDFFTPASALIFMFITVAYVAFVSVRYNREPLAIASLLLGAIAPGLTFAPAPDIAGLSLYLLALVIGTVWVVYRLKSSVLTFLALGVVLVHTLPYIDAASYADQLIGLLFSFVFTMIFLITNIVSILYSRTKQTESVHYITAIGTGAYLMLWVAGGAPELWHTPLYLIWMLVFATVSFLVYIKTTNRVPFYIYGSVSLGLLAAATATLFEGAVLTIMYAIELGILILLANNVVLNSLVARRLALLYIGIIVLSMQHLTFLTGYASFSAADFSALLVVTISLALTGYSLTRTKPDIATDDSLQPGPVLLSAALGYVLAIIWLTLHQNLPNGDATTISLVIYTIIGLAFYIQGRVQSITNMMLAGKIIIGGVVLRLLIIDVWQLAVSERIVVFFIIGILLISTAFLKQKPKLQ